MVMPASATTSISSNWPGARTLPFIPLAALPEHDLEEDDNGGGGGGGYFCVPIRDANGNLILDANGNPICQA